MALPALLSGTDCGPVNPLQALSKQFDRDRGIQQDHFGPGRAGPSREVFRTQSAPAPDLQQEAARFFSGQASNSSFAPQHATNAFDLSALRGSLPQQQITLQSPPSAWAGDFLSQSMQVSNAQPHMESNRIQFEAPDFDRMDAQHFSPMNNTFLPGMFRPLMHNPPVFHDVPHPNFVNHHSDADSAAIQVLFPPEEIQQQTHNSEPIEDELARTAGQLIETVKDESNPKFQNSAFLGFMRQLRDKEMVVEGSEVVMASSSGSHASATPSMWAQEFANSADVKGKGKAIDAGGWSDAFQETARTPLDNSEAAPVIDQQREIREDYRDLLFAASEERFEREQATTLSAPRKSVHFDNPEVLNATTLATEQAWQEAENDEDRYWRQENAEFQEYWESSRAAPENIPHAAAPEWDRLQCDWDRFEATATGIRPVTAYQFQSNNPYVLGDSSTRNHTIHMQHAELNESVIEKEAAVQNNVRNSKAWFELGVKQQENEREIKAIQALQRAVELDPSYLEAWLALAISHTNEGDRSGAYDAIEHWVRNNERYEGARLMALLETNGEKTVAQRHEELIQCLVGLARTAPEGEVDADIQTALGVLLNTSEDYAKAQDCFRTALAVRPSDWLLYNRVGATLANSGRADEALWYYYRALELNPSYIRARFNLGISCINMKKYTEAAEHILDALVLQENDASEGVDARGITSSALWDCLRTTCVQLQRMELAALCDAHDLEGIRKVFWT